MKAVLGRCLKIDMPFRKFKAGGATWPSPGSACSAILIRTGARGVLKNRCEEPRPQEPGDGRLHPIQEHADQQQRQLTLRALQAEPQSGLQKYGSPSKSAGEGGQNGHRLTASNSVWIGGSRFRTDRSPTVQVVALRNADQPVPRCRGRRGPARSSA